MTPLLLIKFKKSRAKDFSDLLRRCKHFEGSRWVIDKGCILNVLEKESMFRYLDACPVFDFEKVKKAVEDLPDEIVINENWQVITRTELRKEGFVEIPYSITPAEIETDDEQITEVGHSEEGEKKEIDPENMSEEEIN